MTLRFLDDPGYKLGMIRDTSSWLLPPGAVYDSLNMIYDRPGIARQRGGTTAIFSGAQTAFSTSIGWVRADDATQIEELYGLDGRTGTVYAVNKTTGAATALVVTTATGAIGRPARHFGFLIFPSNGSTLTSPMVAGQTTTTTFQNTAAAASTTAGSPQITLTGADVTTNVRVGAVVAGQVAGGVFVARVVSIDTTKKFSVWPVPTSSLTFPAGALTTGPVSIPFGGRCVTSFQNRVLWGNTFDTQAYQSSAAFSISDRRITYSVLPTENGNNVGGVTYGAGFYAPLAQPFLNYEQVPGSDPIVAMEPLADNELLILTATHPVIMRGDLTTQTADSTPVSTTDLSEINQPAGCLQDLSVQRTPKGIVWAGAGGVYAYNGGSEVANLMRGYITGYWRDLGRGGSSFAVHGSAYVRGQYIVSGTTAAGVTFSLACDMNESNPKWTRLSGAGTDVFYGVQRPTDPTQVFANRWWDRTGAAPSMTNGQVVRLESMMDSYTAGSTKTDADGSGVTISLTTRVIGGDTETQKTFPRGTVRHQQASTTAAVTVTAQTKIDAADISASTVRTLGALSNTSTLTITNATNANPIVVTTSANHGLQTDDFVDIDGVTGNTNANGRWRISVTGSATFSLVGGIGNGAFGGSPTCKKLTETDYTMSSLNKGQGVSLKFDGAPNNLELHGARIAVLEAPQVMSA